MGHHKGIWNYTIGQRKGLGVSSTEPLYVLSLKKDTNEVVVGPADKTFRQSLVATNLNLLTDLKPNVTAKFRSTQEATEATEATLEMLNDNEVKGTLAEPQKSIAIGQSIVFYDGDIVLGGGIINS